jgi:hypothetical protein
MQANDFTKDDYFSASINRFEDFKHLRTNQKSIIFTLYCAGVSTECMFRAYILNETKEFDSKHDLYKLFIKSKMMLRMSESEREQLSLSVKRISDFWFNNLRYTSDKRAKRKIAHKLVQRTNFKDINKYLEKQNIDIFEATEKIIEIGKNKWT